MLKKIMTKNDIAFLNATGVKQQQLFFVNQGITELFLAKQ